jgi:hypothetical protein
MSVVPNVRSAKVVLGIRELIRTFAETPTELILKMTVFWDVAPCSLIETDCFGGVHWLHHQSSASQKTVIFILASVRT